MSPTRRRTPVALLATAVWIGAAALAWIGRGGGNPGDPWLWFGLAGAYAVTEMCLVHFEHRNEAQSLSFSAVPLVAGLLLFSAPQVVAARVVGSIVALVLHRRQGGVKLAVNVGSFGIADGAAALVFHGLASAGEIGPAVWPAAFAAAVVSDQIQGLVVTSAIALHQGRFELLGGPALLGPVVAVVNTGFALVAVTLFHTEPLAVALLALAVPILAVSYRVHARLVEQHRNLEQLYDFVRSVNEAVVENRVIATLLDQFQELMHADAAWICVADEAGVLHVAHRSGMDEPEVTLMPLGSIDDLVHRRAQWSGEPTLVGGGCDAELGSAMATIGVRQLLLAPLGPVGGAAATVVVADRSGEVRDFQADDLRLFATLIGHASTTLENDHLLDRLRAQAAESEFQALHDPLTGLANRTLFAQELVDALDRDRSCSVLLLDLYRFKEVNDTLGHHNGDVLLCSVARRLEDAVGAMGRVARFGGDEFSVLLPDAVTEEDATVVVRRVQRALREPLSVAGLDIVVGASIGIAMAPRHGNDVATLVRRADIAMYAAKSARSGVETYDPAQDDHSPDRLLLAGRLRDAIDAGDLAVYFQPQLSLARGAVVGAEALVRWAGDPSVQISPAELVAIAENTGLIRPLTNHVLDVALAQCRRWRDAGQDLRVSVNLSAHDLLDAGLVGDVLGRLDDAGLPPDALCLELTETSVMADPERTVAALHQLHLAGIEIAVDDFGTGYSSLSYLSQLPVSEVKIDRSFVSGILEDADDEVIVRSVVDLGRNLRLRVVAEGIETPAMRQRLEDLGCSVGQGYLFARPLPPDDFARWLSAADDGASATLLTHGV